MKHVSFTCRTIVSSSVNHGEYWHNSPEDVIEKVLKALADTLGARRAHVLKYFSDIPFTEDGSPLFGLTPAEAAVVHELFDFFYASKTAWDNEEYGYCRSFVHIDLNTGLSVVWTVWLS